MNPEDLLAELKKNKIEISAKGENISIRGAIKTAPVELLSLVKVHKQELLWLLNGKELALQKASHPCPVDARSGDIKLTRSNGEVVWVTPSEYTALVRAFSLLYRIKSRSLISQKRTVA